MKKILLVLGFMASLYGVSFGLDSPGYQAYSTNGISLYVVGGATTSAVTFQVTVNSVTIVSTGGLYPGTTTVWLYDTDKDTIGELITWFNSVPSATVGMEGGVVASLPQGAYEGNNSSSMTVIAPTNVFGVANKTTFALDNIIGMSYVIPATQNSVNLFNCVINATFAAGTPVINIYEGTTTNSQIRKETAAATTVDKVLNIPSVGLRADRNSAMRIDFVNTSVITAGYINTIWEHLR